MRNGTEGRTIDRSFVLCIAFVIAMLVPNIVLAVTEPYSVSTVIASLLLPAGFYTLWLCISKNPGTMILWGLPLMVLAAFQLVISYLFGNSIIAVDMFTNVFTTSGSEAGELLKSIYPSIIFVCVIYIPLLVFAGISVSRKYRITRVRRNKFLAAGGILLLAGGIFTGISYSRKSGFSVCRHIFPVNVTNNIIISAQRWGIHNSYFENTADFSFSAVRQPAGSARREIYVYVIGEASRAASWGCFGYERETTPVLDSIPGTVFFRDLVTQSNTTHKSVPMMLSPVSAENYDRIYDHKGICTLFSEAGFRTAFLSNQPENRSMIDHLAHEADTHIRIAGNARPGQHPYDTELLPVLDSLINVADDDLFVVLHLYGSHATYNKRYPPEDAVFLPDEYRSVTMRSKDMMVNAYDNTVLYTDRLLGNIIDLISGDEICSALFFCSDHGEDLMDDDRKRFLHASPTTTYYQLHVPALAWLSGNFREQFPHKASFAEQNTDKAASTSNLFSSIADLAGISSPYVNPARSLFGSGFREQPQMYVTDHDESVNFVNTGMEDEDFIMLESMGIKFDPRERVRFRF